MSPPRRFGQKRCGRHSKARECLDYSSCPLYRGDQGGEDCAVARDLWSRALWAICRTLSWRNAADVLDSTHGVHVVRGECQCFFGMRREINSLNINRLKQLKLPRPTRDGPCSVVFLEGIP